MINMKNKINCEKENSDTDIIYDVSEEGGEGEGIGGKKKKV